MLYRSRSGTHHFKAIRAVNHQQDQIRNLRNVDHGVEVVVALQERDTFLLPADDGDGTLNLVEGLFGVSPDERLHQSGLSDSRRADDSNNSRWRLVIWRAVDQGDMEASLVAFSCATALPFCSPTGSWSKSLKQNISAGDLYDGGC